MGRNSCCAVPWRSHPASPSLNASLSILYRKAVCGTFHQVVDREFVHRAEHDVARREREGEIARGRLPSLVPVVQEGRAHRRADAARQLLRLRHDLEQDADLMPPEGLILPLAEHRVHPVVVEADLVIPLIDLRVILLRLLHDRAFNFLQLLQQDRIADACDHEGAVRGESGSLKLDVGLRLLDVSAAAHAHDATSEIREPAVLQIQHEARAMEQIRVLLLVEGVGCHADLRTGAATVQRLDGEVVVADRAEDAVLRRPRLRAQRPALQDLAQMIAEPRVLAVVDPHSCERRRIIGSPAHDDLAARFQRLEDRLMPHLPDDALRLADRLLGELRDILRQRHDRVPPQGIQHLLLREVRPDDGELRRQPLLPQDLLDDVERPHHMRPGPGPAGRTDDHRDLPRQAGSQDDLQVLLHGPLADDRDSGAELVRPAVR